MAGPLSLLRALGASNKARKQKKFYDRVKAMSKARRRFVMAAPDPRTGAPSVPGHRRDVLSPERADALKTRSEYEGLTGTGDPEALWLERNKTRPPWWEMPVAKGSLDPSELVGHYSVPDYYDLAPSLANDPLLKIRRHDLTEKALDIAHTQGEALDFLEDPMKKMYGEGQSGFFQRGWRPGEEASEGIWYPDVGTRPGRQPYGVSTTPAGSKTYRHETLHGLLSTMTPEEAKTMTPLFRFSHRVQPRYWTGKNTKMPGREAVARLADEAQAWSGSTRGDQMGGFREFLSRPTEMHVPGKDVLDHRGRVIQKTHERIPALSAYLHEYHRPELAELYRRAYENRESIGVGAGAAAGASGVSGRAATAIPEVGMKDTDWKTRSQQDTWKLLEPFMDPR